MPTVLPRVLVTETEELRDALVLAAQAWPEERTRAGLLRRLAVEGSRHLEEARAGRGRRRQVAFERHQGRFRGVFDRGLLHELHEDWPE